jgi:cytoskeletal protein CcmA (bactofilin family)
MKKIGQVLFCLLSFLNVILAKSNSKKAVFYGATSLHDMKLPSLDVAGAFKGKQLTIEKDAEVKGACLLKKSSAAHLNVKGSLSAKEVKVEHLSVRGSCKAEQLSVAKNCEMHGAVTFRKAFISGKTSISGACEMVDSSIRDLEWTGEQLILKDTQVKNILVKKLSNRKVQKVILDGKTIIDGSITFEAKEGEVEAEKTVEIKGKIIRGSTALKSKKEQKKNKGVQEDKGENDSLFDQIEAWFVEAKEWVMNLFQ